MATLHSHVETWLQQARLSPKGVKEALTAVLQDFWPDVPPWSTLPNNKPVIQEVETATFGIGVLLTYRENGMDKVVLLEGGEHFDRPNRSAEGRYTIPGGHANFTNIEGSSLVPAQEGKPENARIAGARETEEEMRFPDGSPVLQVDPKRLKPLDTETIVLPWGEKRIVMSLTMELTNDERDTVKDWVNKMQTDPDYRAAASANTVNKATGKPEIRSAQIFNLKDVIAGKVPLLNQDQASLFPLAEEQLHPQSRRRA